MTKPEYEHPGVYVEERPPGAAVEGVPTDALTARDRRRWAIGLTIGAIVLTGLGIGLAIMRGNVIFQFIEMPGGGEIVLSIIGAAILFGTLKSLVEWRRRATSRPPLRRGRLAHGLVIFQLTTLIALLFWVLAWAASLLAARSLASAVLDGGINILVGCVLLQALGGALRDLLLLAQVARFEP